MKNEFKITVVTYKNSPVIETGSQSGVTNVP
jgi:hypothetical protein